jgi:hypothetical protein
MRVLVVIGVLFSSVCFGGYVQDIKPKSMSVSSIGVHEHLDKPAKTGAILKWFNSIIK